MSRNKFFALALSFLAFQLATATESPATTTKALAILSAINSATEFTNDQNPTGIHTDPVYLKNEFLMILGDFLAVEKTAGWGEIKIHSTECHEKDEGVEDTIRICTAGFTYNDGKNGVGYRFESPKDKIEAKKVEVTYFSKK